MVTNHTLFHLENDPANGSLVPQFHTESVVFNVTVMTCCRCCITIKMVVKGLGCMTIKIVS